jgi:hypothetical protein
MKTVTLELPSVVSLSTPPDSAPLVSDGTVRILAERVPAGLAVRWDDRRIEFVSANAGVSYPWSIIGRFVLDRRMRIRNWELIALEVELPEVWSPLLIADRKDESAFDAFVTTLIASGVPIVLSGD